MKPVLYRYRDSDSVIKQMDGYTPGEGWEPLYDQAAMDAAIAAALERARYVEVCDAIAHEWRVATSQSDQCADASMDCADAALERAEKACEELSTAEECATAIRALKESKE